MASDGRQRGGDPVPEAPPPDFHRTAKRKAAKPYALQWRVVGGVFFHLDLCRDWGTLKRYARAEQAMEAFNTNARKETGRWGRGGYRPRHSEYRVVGPDGDVLATMEVES